MCQVIHRLHTIAPPSRWPALGRVEPELVGLPGRPDHRTPREGSGSLSMHPVGYTPSCSMDTDAAVDATADTIMLAQILTV